MERKIEKFLDRWSRETKRNALMIRGPRQVGKTYSIMRFIESHYSTRIAINFEDEPLMKSVFEDGISADEIFDRIGFLHPIKSFENSVLFMDEIQSCPNAISALKPLVIDGRCDIICSGSLLSDVLDKERLTPIGYVDTIRMDPLDYEEFLWAMGFTHHQTDSIRSHIERMEPFDRFTLGKLNDLFRRYIVIGGMPAAVSEYAETGLYAKAAERLIHIHTMMTEDALKFAESAIDKSRIFQCIDSIPRQLSRENDNSFLYSDIAVNSRYGKREYGSAIMWLESAGIIDICHNVEEISEPFRAKTAGKTFKIYMRDTGLLTTMLGPSMAKGIVDNAFATNNGAIVENAIAEALIRRGFKIHYYSSPARRMELDFVFNYNGKLTIIEVKSGRKKSAKSLNKALLEDKQSIDLAIKISDSNLSVDENGVRHYPLFGPSFFEECCFLEPRPLDDLDR